MRQPATGVGPGKSAPPTQASVMATLEAIHKVVGTATVNKGKVTPRYRR
jgi:hypothetical protein